MEKPATETLHGKRINVERKVKEAPVELESRVNALDVSGDVWLASSGIGLLTSRDRAQAGRAGW